MPGAAATDATGTATETKVGDAATAAGDTNAGDAATATQTTGTETKTETKSEDYTLAPIEGGVLDEAGVAQVQTLAKDLGLSKEAAEKLLTAQDAAFKANQDAQLSAWEARKSEWVEACKADPEIGGAKAEVADKHLAAVLQRFDSTGEFTKELEATGFDKHPIVRRFIARIGASMSEDGGAGAGAPAAKPKTRAEILYPNG
jgi:hypothetical protein